MRVDAFLSFLVRTAIHGWGSLTSKESLLATSADAAALLLRRVHLDFITFDIKGKEVDRSELCLVKNLLQGPRGHLC
jgi:hypothetical protein